VTEFGVSPLKLKKPAMPFCGLLVFLGGLFFHAGKFVFPVFPAFRRPILSRLISPHTNHFARFQVCGFYDGDDDLGIADQASKE
jgi:hypothetical protein